MALFLLLPLVGALARRLVVPGEWVEVLLLFGLLLPCITSWCLRQQLAIQGLLLEAQSATDTGVAGMDASRSAIAEIVFGESESISPTWAGVRYFMPRSRSAATTPLLRRR